MSTRSRVALLAALATCLAMGCATAQNAPPPAPETQAYRIGPPDKLEISILPDPPIVRQVTVRPDGMISVDLVGDIPAAGRTTEEVAHDIQTRISRFKRDANVTVALQQSLSTEITVLGEVGGGTTFPLTKDTRLIEAIGKVGGAGQFAAKDNVRIIRLVDGRTQVLSADLDAIESGDLSTNYLLQGGDIIVVPPTFLAKTGYAIQSVLFPIQQLLGFGAQVTTRVVTGGAP
jgi:polysaccharide export outer membrane protein